MPNEIAKDFVFLLTYLLPGFFSAWIFYGLTSHPKPSQFERVVQALVFTFIIHTLIGPSRLFLEQLGTVFAIRAWDKAAEGLTSSILAVVLGVTLAYFANKDSVHKRLRKLGFTTRTSHPSEWYCVFSEKIKFVVLHLHDGRRLYGWPKEWPTDPKNGQFYIMLPSWMTDNGEQIDLSQLDGVLISTDDVRWVEFVNDDKE